MVLLFIARRLSKKIACRQKKNEEEERKENKNTRTVRTQLF